MNVRDIPQEMMDKIRLRFEGVPDVRLLRTKQQLAQREGRFADALKIAEQIEGLFSICVQRYMDKADKEVMTLDSEVDEIPRKDKDEMIVKLMVLFMACDIIESAVIDLNDILHRSRPGIDITTFDDLKQVSEMAKDKLRYLQEKGDYMKDLIWAEKCDNMYDMMQSKAKSIIRKRMESTDCGKNMEKYG